MRTNVDGEFGDSSFNLESPFWVGNKILVGVASSLRSVSIYGLLVSFEIVDLGAAEIWKNVPPFFGAPGVKDLNPVTGVVHRLDGALFPPLDPPDGV